MDLDLFALALIVISVGLILLAIVALLTIKENKEEKNEILEKNR